jgi:hypothetical protein
MNRVSLKVTPGTDLQSLLQELATLGPKLMFDLGPKLVSMTAKTTRDFLASAGELITATLPKIEIPAFPKHCCEIPETECPSCCVCEICWKACPRGTAEANIKVINTGTATRNFTFSATPFSGPGNPATTFHVSPASASLAPNASVNVTAAFTVTSEFQPGGRYEAELRVFGAYEQCVRITLDIEPAAKDCAVEHCEVKAGDLPVRIRAHQWYEHFQCTEPCAELLRHSPNEVRRSGHL